ncbi:sensor histidine kinase [Bacillus sp. B15-48]|uniref:sensor histidine kinase n=1 Tax=Bacillus sp. B15-48 TaxID=1548601 RepID=UPI00193F631B|nr:sensor histidine kinase [Bacillus sp. B15-48]MBM4763403.1 sensor histidine kinase [Bacillus sp. B15-48]
MFKRYWKLLKTTGISPYIWTILSILPFYFILQSPAMYEKIIGVALTIIFFVFYRLAFISKGWTVYLWTIILICISVVLTNLFSFVYFAFFLAYLIGKIQDKIAFFVLYFINLFITSAAINLELFLWKEQFVWQLPFVLIVWLSIIFLPLSMRNKKVQGQLEEKLEDANKRIAELVKAEERQRIARDLHDTLGQKLSLIGLKADLASKLVYKNPEQARSELKDVQQTARTALNEVRKMVSEMRGIRLKDELNHVKQMFEAAQIGYICEVDLPLKNVSLLSENILSMCLKEAVNNVVKHSGATTCSVTIEQSLKEITLIIRDNGRGQVTEDDFSKGSGLNGMRERLEFVNGSLEIANENGLTLYIKIPRMKKES